MSRLEALRGRVTIADGAWSTELRARGAPPNQPAEALNLSAPEMVEQLARDYIAAGATIITTNTFAANRLHAEWRGWSADLRAVNVAGARLARRACESGEIIVAGSIGPSGRIIAVREVSEDDLFASFAEQAAALAEGGVDAFLLETFTELSEITIAIAAVRSAGDLPIIACMSFDFGPQRTSTVMGAAADECAAALHAQGVDALGCNCGAGAAASLPAVVALRAHTDAPLWVKPNAGVPDLVDGLPVYRQTPEEFTEEALTLIEAGAEIIGGCCGVGPAHIARLARVSRAKSRQRNSS
ncbi:MAG: hypothetical protein D6744_02285 [Planctomycetota bacterium]|nr:MAG: hypothetical protein D6744_02285 [Planctomycetota bacterium]